MLKDHETVNEAAARLQALPRLVQRWCQEGKLPCRKMGRDWLIKRGAETFSNPTQAKLERGWEMRKIRVQVKRHGMAGDHHGNGVKRTT